MVNDSETQPPAMETYPQRDSYFAHHFTRLLTKTAAAQELGPEGTWLLTVIVHQEDAKRYKGPVTFYNTQLMPLCGIGSDRRLCQVRERLVEAGWLHYEAGAKRRPAKYWVLIPRDLIDTTDSPIDEDSQSFSCESQEKAKSIRRESEEKAKSIRRESARPSTLDPIPSPTPKEREGPSLDDVIPDLVSKWNQVPGITHCAEFSKKRRDTLRVRLRDPTFREKWPDAIAELALSSFCQGDNSRNWRATIDWFLRPGTVLKLIEGSYRDAARASPATERNGITDGDSVGSSTENDLNVPSSNLKGKFNDRSQRNSTEWRDRELQKACAD